MDISALALRAQVAWLRGLAGAGFAQIRAGDGFAVSTGLDSNTENGAVITSSVRPGDLDGLLGWLRERAVPASVLVTGPPSPSLTARLIERGLVPERSGHNMGRLVTSFDSGVASPWIGEVADIEELRRNQRVYADDGWWPDPAELDQRVEVAARLGFGPAHPVRHWTATHEGLPVGAATSFQFGDAVLLVHSCVVEGRRRQGIGTALTRVRLAAAIARGAVEAVVFPSPDGYHLHHSLGFGLAPVHPDRCFHLPVENRVSLRAVEVDDLDVFYEHQADPGAAAMAAFPSRDRERFDAHWAKILLDDAVVARTVLADGVVAGAISSWRADGRRLVGYWIGREHWGRAVATRALAQFVHEVPERPLFAHVAVHNAGSIRVLQKSGFQRDHAREALTPDPEEFVFVLRGRNSGSG
ncbi:GNAT family N-acetyltransferase [Actinoplanes sp. NPDC000266]